MKLPIHDHCGRDLGISHKLRHPSSKSTSQNCDCGNIIGSSRRLSQMFLFQFLFRNFYQYSGRKHPQVINRNSIVTTQHIQFYKSSSAIAERPRCRVRILAKSGEGGILQTLLQVYLDHYNVIGLQSYRIQ